MKTIVKILAVVALLCAMAAMPAHAGINAATDTYTTAYGGGISGYAGLRNLQDATPFVAQLSYPDAAQHYTSIVWAITSTSTNSTTNIVAKSAWLLVDWDTTRWPLVSPQRHTYHFAAVTNPPTVTVAQYVTSGQVATVIATVTTNGAGLFTGYTAATVTNAAVIRAVSMPVSCLWVNTTGTTNGWQLLE